MVMPKSYDLLVEKFLSDRKEEINHYSKQKELSSQVEQAELRGETMGGVKISASSEKLTESQPKRRGRPPGSKNRPKVK